MQKSARGCVGRATAPLQPSAPPQGAKIPSSGAYRRISARFRRLLPLSRFVVLGFSSFTVDPLVLQRDGRLRTCGDDAQAALRADADGELHLVQAHVADLTAGQGRQQTPCLVLNVVEVGLDTGQTYRAPPDESLPDLVPFGPLLLVSFFVVRFARGLVGISSSGTRLDVRPDEP